jgi:hypothetical protein
MIPLRSDITSSVLYLLGDTQVTGGSIFTAAFQAPLLNLAYMELFGKLALAGADRIQREGYYVLPAYTGVFTPSLAGITNFGGPVKIRERGTVATYAVSAATPSSPSPGLCALTIAPLPTSVITGAQAEVYNIGGLTDEVNDSWFLTVNSTTSVVLNGCTASGTYVSGGTLAYSTEKWSDSLDPKDNTDDFTADPGSSLGMYCWQTGKLRFPPCSTARELKLVYHLSASLPVVASPVVGDSMGVDDSLPFLAHRTAQLCAASKGNPRAQVLQSQADYFLALMVESAARQQQSSEALVPGMFRLPRNTRPTAW